MANYNDNDSIMEKVLRKLIIIVVITALALPFITPKVFAASTVSIGCGSEIKGGETFTVIVAFGGGSVGRVIAYMNYDSSRISYISGGSSTGDSGYIQLNEAGIDGTISFELKFKALKDGDTTLEVITNEIYDLDEMMLDDQPSASKTIHVSGSAASDNTGRPSADTAATEETMLYGVDERPDDETEADTSSEDADITKILVITAAILAALIAIIAIVLISRKNMKNRNVKRSAVSDHMADDTGSAAEELRDWSSEREERRREFQEEHEKQKAIRKKASQETELWDDWQGINNGDDDDWIK